MLMLNLISWRSFFFLSLSQSLAPYFLLLLIIFLFQKRVQLLWTLRKSLAGSRNVSGFASNAALRRVAKYAAFVDRENALFWLCLVGVVNGAMQKLLLANFDSILLHDEGGKFRGVVVTHDAAVTQVSQSPRSRAKVYIYLFIFCVHGFL